MSEDLYGETNGESEELLNEEEYDDPNLCRLCRGDYIDRTGNPSSVICSKCREKAIRYPISKKVIVFLILVFVASAISWMQFPKVLDVYRTYAKASESVGKGELFATMEDLMELVKAYPDSTDVAVSSVKCFMDYGYYDSAAYVMDNYLAGKEVDDDTYQQLDQYYNQIDQYYTTYQICEEIFQDLDGSAQSEEANTYLQEELSALLVDGSYYKPLVYYYLSMITVDSNLREQYLKSCIDADPTFLEAKVQLGTELRRRNDIEGARKLYQEVLYLEKTYSSALRGMAVLDMLEGNLENAIQKAKEAYLSSPDELYVRETYMIALALSGMEEERQEIEDEITASGEIIEQSTVDLMNGTISLKEYYIQE